METPLSYHDLVENLGAALADELVRKFGGTSPYVPARMREDHPLAVELGLKKAETVSAVYHTGGSLYIPNMRAISIRARVIALRKDGVQINEIARLVDRTEVRVYQILAEQKADSRQLDMFEKSTHS